MIFNQHYEYYDDDLEPETGLYEEEMYEYNTFGERIGQENEPTDLSNDELTEAVDADAPEWTEKSDAVEKGFGETLKQNPHLGDQLEDPKLNQEAENEYEK